MGALQLWVAPALLIVAAVVGCYGLTRPNPIPTTALAAALAVAAVCAADRS